MVIDTTKCIGCGACRLACQNQNDLLSSMPFVKFSEVETGVYPTASLQVVPSQCMHCEDAPCTKVCPTGATVKRDDGIVTVDEETCIGCKSCLRLGCPAISFDAGAKKAKIDRVACAGCGVCAQVCPKKAMGKVGG